MLLVFFLNIFLTDTIHAKTINFSQNNYRYELKFDLNTLSFKDSNTDLSLIAKKCNQHILKYSKVLIENFLSHEFNTNQSEDSIRLEIDHKVFYESPHTTRGTYFKNFRKYILSKKIEEDLNCSK